MESKKREEVSRKITATVTTIEREGPLAELTTLVPRKMTTTMMSSWKCLLTSLSIFFTSVDIISLFFLLQLAGPSSPVYICPLCWSFTAYVRLSIWFCDKFVFLGENGSNAHVP